MRDPVAIIGMSCRFAGAPDVAAFWDLLAAGREGVSEYKPGRTAQLDGFYAAAGTEFGAPTRRGGFIDGIEMFDADFFGISAREALLLDPQQRLFLEVGWEALEDAGQVLEEIAGPRTGIFVGASWSDYGSQLDDTLAVAELFAKLGSGVSGFSGRLAYSFDFRGPEVTINSGCASSLSAIHHAVGALRNGACDLALVGGVNAIVRPELTQAFGRAGALSSDGRCKFGDHRADGFVRGEGCGMLVLKRLDHALRDGDRIRAVVRGSAINSFGASGGFLTRPSEPGQVEVIDAALADAGVSPAAIDYVEAHGTGTTVGDRIELSALSTVLGRHPDRSAPCRLGSAKSTIGHTECAAGAAGVIRTVLAMEHRHLPATLHVECPNPAIDWATAGIVLNTAGHAWTTEHPRRAGVSGFGVTGSSAHIILEEAPDGAGHPPAPERDVWCLPLSARSPEALKRLAAAFAEALQQRSDIADMVYTAARRRSRHAHRLVACGRSGAEIAARLQAWSRDGAAASVYEGSGTFADEGGGPVLVFPGQGAQWVGMGRDLLAAEPAFRAALAHCDAVVQAETGWSVIDLLADDAALEQADIGKIQPVLFSIQVALAALWASWGVAPAVVVGHSMGEVAAAHVAGALTLEDAAAVICRRSALMATVTERGAMALVELSVEEATSELEGQEDHLSVAVSNGPRTTVLAGKPEALHAVVERLQARGVFCRPLAVQVAAHSPQMDAIRGALLAALEGIRPRAGQVPIFSTTAGRLTDGADFNAAYWVDNLRKPVLFHAAVEALIDDGHRLFVEASPHPVLLPAIEEGAEARGSLVTGLASMRRGESEQGTMLAACAQLAAEGVGIDWRGLYPTGRVVDIPGHPWRRKAFWPDRKLTGRIASAAGGHPLLPQPFKGADRSRTWVCTLNTHTLAWLGDHVVRGVTLLPASAFVEMAVAAGRQLVHDETGDDEVASEIVVKDLRLKEAIVLTPSEDRVVQVVARPDRASRWTVVFHTMDDAGSGWTVAATCVLAVAEARTVLPGPPDVPALLASGAPAGSISASEHAATLKRLGYDFGPAFLNLQWIAIDADEIRAAAVLDDATPVLGYGIHPSLLDAAFQAVAAGFIHAHGSGHQFIPRAIDHACILPAAATARKALAVAAIGRDDEHVGDVRLFDAGGALLADVTGLRFQMFSPDAAESEADLLYDVEWMPGPPSPVPSAGVAPCLILADRQGVGLALAAALQDRSVANDVIQPDDGDDPFGVRDGALERRMATLAGAAGAEVQVVYCGGLDLRADIDVAEVAHVVAEIAALSTLMERVGASPLVLVTRGACAIERPAGESGSMASRSRERRLSVAQAGLWGLGATIANETPRLGARLIDLEADESLQSAANDLAAELCAGPDPRAAWRAGRRYLARVRPRRREALVRALRDGERAALTLETPGVLDSFAAELVPVQRLRPGEIEIEVAATGLNFRDVLRAMGLIDDMALEMTTALCAECAGHVVGVGPGVTRFSPGDRVVALSPDFQSSGTLASHLVTKAALAARIPDSLSMTEAAALPCVYLTSYVALVEVARVRAGETVLIHSATGGVGQSAIAVARHLGATVICSAGTEAKRALLRDQGIEAVIDSRALPFADTVMAMTGGRGVDVVLNSLTGPAIPEGLAALAPYGRFLEIGKRDMWDNTPVGMGVFLRNRAVFGVDLAMMVTDHPDRVGALLETVLSLVGDGALAALPVTVFPAAQAAEAFQLMAAAGHVGKVVIDMTGMTVPDSPHASLRPDDTHLVTGGFGALGLVAAEALVAAGTRSLALCGRTPPNPRAAAAIAALEARGATVLARTLDIGDETAVRSLLADISQSLPPLRGVVHSAGVLSDALLDRITAVDAAEVMRGKVAGALLLDRLTADLDLDRFVLFSSAAALLGSAGQGSYAAANAMLDALARDRRARSLPGLSIAWGPWGEIGLAAAQDNRGARIATRGLPLLDPAEGQLLMGQLLGDPGPYAAAMRFEPGAWIEASATSAASVFDGLRRRGTEAWPGATPILPDAASVASVVERQLAAVLRQEVDGGIADRSFRSLGLDSLMGLELRNRLERALGLKLSASTIWNYPTPRQLSAHLLVRLTPPASGAATPPPLGDVAGPERAAAQALDDELDAAAAALADL